MQWRWYVVPQKKGDPGSETWPNEDAMKHGGGMTWQPFTYDPELNLMYVTTGNPQPVIAHVNRAGANLFTASIVSLNPDTGKMNWYFQSSPHDTHDWDSTQTAVLFDGADQRAERASSWRRPRATATSSCSIAPTARHIVSSEYVKTNWSSGYDEKGQPVPNPEKHPQIDGALVSPNQGGAANWPPPTFSPQTGLFYVNASRAFSVYYIYDPGDNPMGWGGTDRGGWGEAMLQAIDYKTGKVKWSHTWEGRIARRPSQHRGQSDFQRRRVERSGGAQRDDRRAAVARRLERVGQQRRDHVRARRQSVCDRRAQGTRCGRS